ncbi:hypothetical protein JZ751_000133 [Albula glossodonta]|uniref:C2H2-type domain-containing protein n=1 Tax=Albula glossodonta TaxID=121402 RepID=A0A8T2PVD9_9TELE|nr:hypothetical protein JZ751_000133 [Albula glossodonta]
MSSLLDQLAAKWHFSVLYPGMGDMKTPDFDDLLAAFDIPDIDAKEAIQSAPEDVEGHHGGKPADSGAAAGAGPPLRPSSPSDTQSLHLPAQVDPSIVSVIVKNRVRPEVEAEVDKESTDGVGGGIGAGGMVMGSRLGPRVPAMVSSEPLNQSVNGFGAPSASVDPALRQTQGPSNGEMWPPCSPKTAAEGGRSGVGMGLAKPPKQCSNTLNRLKPLVAQGPLDPVGKGRKTLLQQQSTPDGTSEAKAHGSSFTHSSSSSVESLIVPGVSVGLPPPFFPPPKPVLPSPSSSTPPSSTATAHLSRPGALSAAPQPFNGTQRAGVPIGFHRLESEDEDSEPELVIQESPDSPASSTPPKLSHRHRSPSAAFDSPTPRQTPPRADYTKPREADPPASVSPSSQPTSPRAPESWLSSPPAGSGASPPHEERHPEHGAVVSTVIGGVNVPSRPLKVRIKTIKTSSGSITRTVTRVAPKGAASAAGKGSDAKGQPGGRKAATRPRRVDASSGRALTPLQQQQQQLAKGAILPVSTLQDASTAMLVSKPASIVNSTGAVISRSQSSLVEAFNKILNSKNLLPSYRPDLSTPPPPEWSLPLPANGYRCLECGDAFALERSLARHYDRRSLRIEVTCNHCAKRLAFFNKCSLLLHAREHKERGLVMQCSHLVMRPVSIEQMIGQQDTTPIAAGPMAPSPSKESPSAQPSPARRAPESPHALLPLPCKKGEVLQYHNFKCPECQTCMLCSPAMMLPNACSTAAHQRIHKHRSPHVCPECGGIARQASFQTHLEEACLHFARRIGYRCSSCQVVFGGLNSIKSHIQTAHCEVFHKCPSCPMAFKSAPSAQSHISTQHPNLTAPQAK